MADKGRAQRATRPPVRWHPPGGALSCQEHGSAAQDVLLGPGCGQDDDGYGLQVGVGFQLIQDFQAVTARLVQASRLGCRPSGCWVDGGPGRCRDQPYRDRVCVHGAGRKPIGPDRLAACSDLVLDARGKIAEPRLPGVHTL